MLARMHAHAHQNQSAGRKPLAWACALAATYCLAELAGGLYTGSLALLADAGHMFADVAALALALFALWISGRPAPAPRTFGYRRMEILAALINGAALIAVAAFIVLEAFARFQTPQPVLGAPMLLIASGGLVVNLAGLRILHRSRNTSLNLRGAWLHVLSDALGSLGAMAAGLCIWLWDWRLADPIASVVIAALVLHSAWALLRETVDVLLESAPRGLDVAALQKALAELPGVASVRDLHVWSISSGMVSLSCHLRCRAQGEGEGEGDAAVRQVLTAAHALLRENYEIRHVTLQVEPAGFQNQTDIC